MVQTDFSEEPPGEAFRVAFGRPPPAGVTNLRAAGMRGLGGMSVWLRFQATEPIIRELTGSLKPESAKEALEEQRDVMDHDLQYFDPEDRLLWRELYRIPQLQAYEVKREPSGGYLRVFVDRPRGDVFVFVVGT